MDKKDLYREIGNSDEKLILEAESKKKSNTIKKFMDLLIALIY